VQALERVTPNSSDDAFEDALQLLKHAVFDMQRTGRRLVLPEPCEQRLGHTSLAQYSMDKARMFDSDAMQQGLNPFVLATPPAKRALTANAPQSGAPAQSAPAVAGPSSRNGRWWWASAILKTALFPPSATPPPMPAPSQAALKDPVIGRFPADNVHVLTDDQATTKKIKEELNWIARHAQPNDLWSSTWRRTARRAPSTRPEAQITS